MTNDDRLEDIVRASLRPMAGEPAHDLWPRVTDRLATPPAWSWFDIGLAAVVAVVLLLVFPEGFWVLAYHF
jgi:hypothetical protein